MLMKIKQKRNTARGHKPQLIASDVAVKNSMLDPALATLALDSEQYPNAIDYVNLYLEILKVDRGQFTNQDILNSPYIAPFYISDLKSQINKIPDQKLKKRLITFFNLDNSGRRHYLRTVRQNDIATIQLVHDAISAVLYVTTFESMYTFNSNMQEIVDLIATRVRGPESNIVKVKYAHIYYRYIRDFQFLALYDDENQEESTHVRTLGILSDKQIAAENQMVSFQSIGMLLDEWNDCFKDMPENDLIIPAIEGFLNNLDTQDEEFIRKDAQLLNPQITFKPTYRAIRIHKEHIFSSGEWLVSDFMRFSSLNNLYAKDIRELCQLWANYAQTYEWKSEKNVEMEVILPSTGKKTINIPSFSSRKLFKSENEMLAFLTLMEYFRNEEPDVMYHHKALKKYDFFTLLKM